MLRTEHPEYEYFVFDHGRLRKKFDVMSDQAIRAPHRTINEHLSQIYRYNDKTNSLIQSAMSKLNLPDKYMAIHIRRGDKIQEAPCSKLSSYCKAIEASCNQVKLPIYIMSDSIWAIHECKRLFGGNAIVGHSPARSTGYNQQACNKKPPLDRYLEAIEIMTDIEIARSSQVFIGTNTSNIFWLLRHLHRAGPERLVDADQFNHRA